MSLWERTTVCIYCGMIVELECIETSGGHIFWRCPECARLQP